MTANTKPASHSPSGEKHKVTPFGPEYNVNSPALARHRRKARNGLAAMSKAERVAYADAVEAAVLQAQRREAMRALPPMPRPACASGTAYSDGRDIHRAILEQQRRAALAAPSQIRRARPDVEWRQMYDAAMNEKAKAIADRLWNGGTLGIAA